MSDELVRRLRERLGCGENLPDEDILKHTEGTYFRAVIELQMSIEDLGRELKKRFEPLLKLIRR